MAVRILFFCISLLSIAIASLGQAEMKILDSLVENSEYNNAVTYLDKALQKLSDPDERTSLENKRVEVLILIQVFLCST